MMVNWSKTSRLAVEHWETTLGLVIEGWCVVLECMLILSVSAEPLEMCAEGRMRPGTA